MSGAAWWRRLRVRGVIWRQLLRFGVLSVPPWLEPLVIAFWSLFFLLWAGGRRSMMRNLEAIHPGSWSVAKFVRCYRVFWNFAWTIADTVRFKELRIIPDWEFTGWNHFQAMQSGPGAILLTAHMGSYDLGAHLFSETSEHRVVIVRAPEIDPQTRAFEESHAARGLQIEFNTSTGLAIELLHAIHDGAIVAIQGDRVTPGIADLPATLFGRPARVPAGPFALAMAARVPIYPVFLVRLGRRRYRVVARPPIEIVRGSDREETFARAVEAWTEELESAARTWWHQWFAFEPSASELAP
jgi:predicted LPLAT superfamily acyltransferase